MKLNPNATATIIIGGLSLCHQNNKSDTWESLFIRDEKNYHDLKMKVGDGKTQTLEVHINQSDEISVKVTLPKSKTGSYKPTPRFSRNKAVDPVQDLRWVLDFSSDELHGRRLKVEKRARDNFFFTPNALFYTFALAGKHYLLQKTEDGKPVGKPDSLEDIGEFIGGDIECEEGGTITVEIKDKDGKISSYPIEKGSEVFFDNRCLTDVPECENDFHHYYDVIKTGIEEFEIGLAQKSEDDNSANVKGIHYACEGGQICCIEDPDDTLNN